jgi:hypothetical protein
MLFSWYSGDYRTELVASVGGLVRSDFKNQAVLISPPPNQKAAE